MDKLSHVAYGYFLFGLFVNHILHGYILPNQHSCLYPNKFVNRNITR